MDAAAGIAVCAAGATTGDLALVAAGGPNTVLVGGAGIKLHNSAAFDGTLVLDGLTLSSSNASALSLSSFAGLVVLNSTFRTVGNGNDDHAIQLETGSGAPHIVVYDTTFTLGADTSTPLGAAVNLAASGGSSPTILLQRITSTESGSRTGSAERVNLLVDGAGAGVTVRDSAFTASPGGGILAEFEDAGAGELTVVSNTLSTLEATGVAVFHRNTPLDATIAGNEAIVGNLVLQPNISDTTGEAGAVVSTGSRRDGRPGDRDRCAGHRFAAAGG